MDSTDSPVQEGVSLKENSHVAPPSETVSDEIGSAHTLNAKNTDNEEENLEKSNCDGELPDLKTPENCNVEGNDASETCEEATTNLKDDRCDDRLEPRSLENNVSDVVLIENSSLNNLLIYNTDDSSDGDSSSDSESYESIVSSDNEEDVIPKAVFKKKNMQDTIRTFGELTLDDLPPVPDVSHLDINVTEQECVQVGVVTGIIDRLVTVESFPNIPAYDLDTLLFLDNGKKPLGYVYDVMGPVTCPIYVIRFNNKQELENIGVEKGQAIFSAPKTEHTQYVFLKQLMETKGCDASWMGDNEVPPEQIDYSDDEQERKIKRVKSRKSASSSATTDSCKRNSLERHVDFEKDMNVRNLIDSRLHRVRDGGFEPSTKRHAPNAAAVTTANKKREGYSFPTNCATPNYGFSQYAFNSNVPSFGPFYSGPFVHHGLNNFSPFVSPQNLPSVLGHRPMAFSPTVPPPRLPAQSVVPQVQTVVFPNFSVPPPALPYDVNQKASPQTSTRMLYPPTMGLPQPRSLFVPGVSFLEPSSRVSNAWTFQGDAASFRGPQRFHPLRGTYFHNSP